MKIATPIVEGGSVDVGEDGEHDGGFVMGKTLCLDAVHFCVELFHVGGKLFAKIEREVDGG